MRINFTIDRFETNFAVCEDDDRKMHYIEKSKLPAEAKEGDVLIYEDGVFVIDEEGTKTAKESIRKLMDEVFE